MNHRNAIERIGAFSRTLHMTVARFMVAMMSITVVIMLVRGLIESSPSLTRPRAKPTAVQLPQPDPPRVQYRRTRLSAPGLRDSLASIPAEPGHPGPRLQWTEDERRQWTTVITLLDSLEDLYQLATHRHYRQLTTRVRELLPRVQEVEWIVLDAIHPDLRVAWDERLCDSLHHLYVGARTVTGHPSDLEDSMIRYGARRVANFAAWFRAARPEFRGPPERGR